MKNQLQKSVQNFGGLEFASFKLKEGVTEAALFEAIDEMVEGLYKDEECFLGHCLLKDQDVYTEMVFTTDQKSAVYLCEKWGKENNFAKECLSYLNKVDEASTKFAFYERIK